MLDIHIDKLTSSIEEVSSGRTIDTEVRAATLSDLESLATKWRFDWTSELRHGDVYKLVIAESSETIQGLISLSAEADHVFVHLIENHPQNVGRKKRFAGVAGNLFAYACKLSIELGYEGFVSFVAKSELIKHYQLALGAIRIGRSQKMFIDTAAATKLIESYFGEA